MRNKFNVGDEVVYVGTGLWNKEFDYRKPGLISTVIYVNESGGISIRTPSGRVFKYRDPNIFQKVEVLVERNE